MVTFASEPLASEAVTAALTVAQRMTRKRAAVEIRAMDAREIQERREAIRWTQENKHPHGCGDRGGAEILCHQNLDGTCNLKTCDYYGLTASEPQRSE
jgi:hypothetical protein